MKAYLDIIQASSQKLAWKNVDIHSNGDYTGGFVGYNKDLLEGHAGQLIDCYVKGGTVTSNELYTGGFIGYNQSYYVGIENCYSTADVTGSDYVGGFGGHNEFGEIANNFSIGTATATATDSVHESGFFNGNTSVMYNNYYVDNNGKTGNDTSDDSTDFVEHINPEELYGNNLLSLDWDSEGAWDIVNVWKTVEGDTLELLTPIETWADYADRTWMSTEEAAGRDGSNETNAYQIRDDADLAELAVLVNQENTFDGKYIKVADGVTKIDLGGS